VGDLGNFVAPERLPEAEMVNPAPSPQPIPHVDGPVTYQKLPATTSRGKVLSNECFEHVVIKILLIL